MKKTYTITAILKTQIPPLTIPSKTDLDTHRRTHAAGIPQFTLIENRLIALSIQFTATPDPIDPNLPNTEAQNAALRHLKSEISAHYPGAKPTFKLYQTASAP